MWVFVCAAKRRSQANSLHPSSLPSYYNRFFSRSPTDKQALMIIFPARDLPAFLQKPLLWSSGSHLKPQQTRSANLRNQPVFLLPPQFGGFDGAQPSINHVPSRTKAVFLRVPLCSRCIRLLRRVVRETGHQQRWESGRIRAEGRPGCHGHQNRERSSPGEWRIKWNRSVGCQTMLTK